MEPNKINNISYNTSRQSFSGGQSAIQNKLASLCPTIELKSDKTRKVLDWIALKVSSPEQRLILGVTALATQPVIDYYNHKVDEETRLISVARTISKIIAGTVVGVTVRIACIRAAKEFSDIGSEIIIENGKKYLLRAQQNSFLAPKKVPLEGFDKNRKIQYENALGTVLSLGAMLFTNFAIDAPLTQWLTNKFSQKINEGAKHESK